MSRRPLHLLIAALATLAINAAALLLLARLGRDPLPPREDDPPEPPVVVEAPEVVKPPAPPPKPPPPRRTITPQPRPAPRPAPALPKLLQAPALATSFTLKGVSPVASPGFDPLAGSVAHAGPPILTRPGDGPGGDGQGASKRVLEADEVDTPPRVLKRHQPRYPRWAEARGITGAVTLRARLDQTGRVQEVRVVSSTPPGTFDRVAEQAVRRYRFSPASQAGQPVSVWVTVPLEFQLN